MSNSSNNTWHITEDETEIPVRIAKKTKKAPEATQSVSRKPAAIFGVLIVVIVGSYFTFGGNNDLAGQVTETTIRITNSGLEPQVVSVAPGQTITWINEQEIPHYFVSDSLCANGDTNCMTTETAFQNQQITYTIPTSVPGGAYTYFSPTDTNIIGTISVGGSATPPPPSPPPAPENTCYSPSDCVAPEFCSSLYDGIIPGTCITQPVAQNTATTGNTSSQAAVTTTSSQASVPTNPLLESIQKQLELDGSITGGGSPSPNTATPPIASVAGIPENPNTVHNPSAMVGGVQATTTVQMPFQQPNTGLGTWLLACIGLVSFVFVVRSTKHSEVQR